MAEIKRGCSTCNLFEYFINPETGRRKPSELGYCRFPLPKFPAVLPDCISPDVLWALRTYWPNMRVGEWNGSQCKCWQAYTGTDARRMREIYGEKKDVEQGNMKL